MARSNVAQTALSRNAVSAVPTATVGDATNGHSTANAGNLVIWVKNVNAGAVARWIEFERAGRTVDGAVAPARRYTVAAGVAGYLRGFPVKDYGSSLNINVEHADITFHVLAV